MKKYIKSIFSIAIIGVFLAIALACDPEPNKNVDCDIWDTPKLLNQKLLITFVDRKTKEPLKDVGIRCFIREYKKENNDGKCKMQLDKVDKIRGESDDSGDYELEFDKTYLSKDDFILINILYFAKDDYFPGLPFDVILYSHDDSKNITIKLSKYVEP